MIAGYTKGQGNRTGRFGSLLLAVSEAGGLRYAGNVGTGFDRAEIERLLARLRPLERPSTPFAEAPKLAKVRKADIVWVEPELVCEVEFAEWTHDGRLRAPSYQGLREDKQPEEVRREREPIGPEVKRGRRVLKLSNLTKPFWPDEGIAKGDLLSYYRDIAPVVVPHLRDRPFTMKRYPDGAYGKFFFQKDAPSHMPAWIPTRRFEVSTRDSPRTRREIDFLLVNDELALLWVVNMGCIDLNTWYSRVDKPSRPDFVLFDLDPSARRRLRRDDRGGAPRQAGARPRRARLLSEDERLGGNPHPRAGRPAAQLRRDARLLGDRGRSDRARAPEARDDRVDEGEAEGRPDRLEPERRGEDDRLGLLGPAEAGRAGLDAAALGGGQCLARSGGVHHGCRARPGRARRRSLRGRSDDAAVARAPP